MHLVLPIMHMLNEKIYNQPNPESIPSVKHIMILHEDAWMTIFQVLHALEINVNRFSLLGMINYFLHGIACVTYWHGLEPLGALRECHSGNDLLLTEKEALFAGIEDEVSSSLFFLS